MSDMKSLSSTRLWLLLAAAFGTFSIGAGFMHAYTVFLVTFIEAFGWSRAEVSLAYSVSQMVNGVSSPLVGWLVDRLGPPRLILMGGALLTVGLLASSLGHAALAHGRAVRRGDDAGGELPGAGGVRAAAVAVFRAQPRHGGLGRAVGERLRPGVLGAVDDDDDLRPGLARRLSVAGRVHGRHPAAAGVVVPRDRTERPSVGSADAEGWTVRQAVRTPHFWLLFAVYMFTGLGSFLVALHQLAFAVDIGFDKLYAAGVLGMGAFLSLPGVIITGTLSDYIGRELSAVVTYGTSILGVVFGLMITSPDQHLLLWLHACFFGLTWGARGPAITAKTADLFPGPNLGAILGVITIGTGLGAAGGSWLAGFVFDTTGSYRVAFGLSIVFYVAGSIAFWALRRPPALRA